jgi:hypothetical protein
MAVADVPPRAASRPPRFFRLRYVAALGILATAYLLTSVLAPTSILEVPLGLVTLFLVPGYAIASLVFGGHPRWPLSLLFAITVGWSVAFNIALGLALLSLGRGLPAVGFALASFGLSGLALAFGGARGLADPRRSAGSPVTAALRFDGYGPGQRAVAGVLLAAIVVVFVAIVYFASVVPPGGALGLGLSLAGANGSTTSLPTAGSAGSSIEVLVTVQNNATAQSLSLVVRSATVGSTPSSYSTVPWGNPIALGNGTEASVAQSLAGSKSTTFPVYFDFAGAGAYTVTVLLENSAGSPFASVTWSLNIT